MLDSQWKWYANLQFLKTGEVLDEKSETLDSDFVTSSTKNYKRPGTKAKDDIVKKRIQLLDKSIEFLSRESSTR